MSRNRDWLSRNRKELYVQGMLTVCYLEDRMGIFGIEGAAAEWVNSQFRPKWNIFTENFLDCENSLKRTPVRVAALKISETEFKIVYRKLYNGFLKNNPHVTGQDLLAMGLGVCTGNKPARPLVPDTYLDLTLEPYSMCVVKLSFRDHSGSTSGRPKGIAGALIRYGILPESPKSVGELNEMVFCTKTPHLFNFTALERGQWVYCAAAWQNTRGEMGRWSNIVSTLVP
jgi:hypothetical protein